MRGSRDNIVDVRRCLVVSCSMSVAVRGGVPDAEVARPPAVIWHGGAGEERIRERAGGKGRGDGEEG